jgi:hypothetical protein
MTPRLHPIPPRFPRQFYLQNIPGKMTESLAFPAPIS